ncbi:MAG: GntR family transcriptional regulator [Firmicutes bacterium]|nr:GntR family transcriptional regulator [Bacillota bacterium]MBR6584905.1 GntR family transcriptional regulator [Bacillota bacterium]
MTANKDFSNSFSLTDEIADVVRERILKGEYEIGEKIKENQIATELRVSRTPIREAFKLLENEGLIDYIPNRGCFAKGFTQQDVDDIYAVREALEELAVRWAVGRISADEVTSLEEQCDLMEFYTKKKDSKKVFELNNSFHDVIYASARSRFLAQVLRSYKEYIDKTRKSFFYEQSYLEGILSEHRAILDAIKEGDVDKAVEAMARHMDASKQRAEAVWIIK